MANRHLLAVNKLEEFKNWLIENNWKIEKTKGNYEVLRARKSTEKLPLIVYKKDKDGLIHLSVSDWNAKYVADFINSKKDNKSNNLQQQLKQQLAEKDKEIKRLKEIKIFKDSRNMTTKINGVDFSDEQIITLQNLDVLKRYDQTRLTIKELEKAKDLIKHFCEIHSDEYYGVKSQVKGIEQNVCESIDNQIKILKGE